MRADITKDKVVSLLSSLDKYQLNRLKKFLQSPYFNEKEDLLLFFNALNTVSYSSSKQVIRLDIWKKVHGRIAYDEQKYRRLASDLTQLIYRFIAIEWQEKQPFMAQIALMKEMNSVLMHKHFNTALRDVRKQLNKEGGQNANSFYSTYVTEFENHLHEETLSPKKITLESLKKADKNLDFFYITTKLKHYCDCLNYKNILSIDGGLELLPGMLTYIKEQNLLEIPVVNIYYQIYCTLEKPDEEKHFYDLLDLLDKNHTFFSRTELRTMYVYATNYCITKINEGYPKFRRELYDLYFVLLGREIIFNNAGELNERHYKNIVALGISFKEHTVVEEFIKDYSMRLPKSKRENAMAFNLANVYFSKKDYDKAMEQLRYVSTKSDFFYTLGIKSLMLKIYFEIDDFSLFNSFWDSFNIYLRRHQLLSKSLKRQYLGFLKYIKKIYFASNYKKNELKTILEEMTSKGVYDQSWLVEKIKEKLG